MLSKIVVKVISLTIFLATFPLEALESSADESKLANEKKKTMLIAQITDTHIVPEDQHWKGMSVTDVHGRLSRVVQALNELNPLPEVVLLTGDAIDKGGIVAYEHLKEILKPLIIPYYLIPGNHDSREDMRSAFSHTRYMPQDGLLQYVIDDYPVRLIGIDTQVPGHEHGILSKQTLAWLKGIIENNPEKPALLFMHHFPINVGQKCFDDIRCYDETEGGFKDLIASSSNIIGLVSGHYHKCGSAIFGGKVCFICPSVAPVHFFKKSQDATPVALDLINPSYTLHKWDNEERILFSEVNQVISSDKRIK